jgi:hypothetical protein
MAVMLFYLSGASANATHISKLPLAYYISHIMRINLLYLGFLLLNFAIVPALVKKESVTKNILLAALLFITTGIVYGITGTYINSRLLAKYSTLEQAYEVIFRKNFWYAAGLFLLFAGYALTKYACLYLLTNADNIQQRYSIVKKDALLAFVFWMISMFVLLVCHLPGEVIIAWSILVPFAILLYCYSFYKLIPFCLRKKRPLLAYIFRMILLLFVSFFVITLLLVLFIHEGDASANFSLINAFFQLLVTAPLSWILFKRQMKGKEELFVLKKELGQSNASLDFLRSQINPHFLFNALNTIYGTALQENAERTAEGVERLGDMMRFMLQENVQDMIPLQREMEYLDNYITLQKLRTDPNPNITIYTEIEQQLPGVQLAPMLLIPFVENAFKHGISFREPSYIKITLATGNNTLYFDVSNSKHHRPDNDPEKDKSGIGLNNVRQRLQVLYPGRHQLVIDETAESFFVHLTVQF